VRRIPIAPRPDWVATAEKCGFKFHTIDGSVYWDESAYYAFTLEQIEKDIEDPTSEIHEMAMALVDEVVDTPTSLYEASFFQWVWLDEQRNRGQLSSKADQYNLIQELLVGCFATIAKQLPRPFYFSAVRDSAEDQGTIAYLRDCATQSGLDSSVIAIEDIGLSTTGRFTDLNDIVIGTLFKLYPYEMMQADKFGIHLPTSGLQLIEPAWKTVLSNKGILPLLWERHAGHPNLLPAFFDDAPTAALPAGWARKPLHSREGANITMALPTGQVVASEGPYADGPMIRQAYHPLTRFEGGYPLIGSWVVGDRPAGMGIREDVGLITQDTSRFVPHVIL